jgi:hypothetical protein
LACRQDTQVTLLNGGHPLFFPFSSSARKRGLTRAAVVAEGLGRILAAQETAA